MTSMLISVTLDEASTRYHNIEIRHERETAVADLIRENQFHPVEPLAGPYALRLALEDDRLKMTVIGSDGQTLDAKVGLRPFQRLMKDYFLIWESYGTAMRGATAEQVQAIDMGRRALHNEGADMLTAQLENKIAIDHETARRLFTLLCVLHIK